MRVIEVEMVQAVRALKNWSKDNTRVKVQGNEARVYLFENHIADVVDGVLAINESTLARWPTRTTKSRIKALRAGI
jgi:hypothetical protein